MNTIEKSMCDGDVVFFCKITSTVKFFSSSIVPVSLNVQNRWRLRVGPHSKVGELAAFHKPPSWIEGGASSFLRVNRPLTMVRARVNGSNKCAYRVKARALGLQLV